MKLRLILLLFSLAMVSAQAQTSINKTFDVQGFSELDLAFKYPKLVTIEVWDRDEVKLEGTVNIQGKLSDEDFEIKTSKSGDRFSIQSKINNLRNHSNIIVSPDSDDEEEQMIVTSGKGVTMTSGKRGRQTGDVYLAIELVITIPEKMDVLLDARYGLVEVLQSPSSLEIDARYGGVDVTIDESSSLRLAAKTQWGQIFSNLAIPVEMGGDDMIGKWLKARASLKAGDNQLEVASQYGNVYLRKN